MANIKDYTNVLNPLTGEFEQQPSGFDKNKNGILKNYVRTQSTKAEDIAWETELTRPNRSEAIDVNWVRNKFGISNKELTDERLKNGRFFSTASYKYSSSRLGCHLACNAKPQFTRYADIKPSYNTTREKLDISINTEGNGETLGMGRYYSEAIDDNAMLAYMTFGVKQFNGLLDTIMSAVDYGDTITANTGRQPLFYNIGSVVGAGLVFACFPFTTMLIWSIKALSGFLGMDKAYSYYYMMPTMHNYWSVVNNLATQFATEIKLISPYFENRGLGDDTQESHDLGVKTALTKSELEHIAKILGKRIFNADTGYLDIYAIMAEPQAMYRNFLRRKAERLSSSQLDTAIDESGAMLHLPNGNESVSSELGEARSAHVSSGMSTFEGYLDKNVRVLGGLWSKDEKENIQGGGGDTGGNTPIPKSTDGSKRSEELAKLQMATPNHFTHNFHKETDESSGFMDRLLTSIDSGIHDGGMSAIFQVEYVGSVNESFSNSVKDIDTEGGIKSISTGVQDAVFNFSGGNLGMGVNPGAVVSAGKELLAGTLNSMTFGLGNVVTTILGDAYLDLPKRWADSETTLTNVTYNIKLRAPYNNVFSIQQSIIIPFCMLLAGVLPQATGKSSYTSPFLCNLNCQGVQNIKLGMITSMTVTRGVTNLPYNRKKQPLGLDISFTVTDFSTILASPVSKNIFEKIMVPSMDDNTPIGRYIATVGGRDVQTDKYTFNKLGMRLANARAAIDAAISPHFWGANIGMALNAPLSLFTAQGNMNIGIPGSHTR